MEEGNRNVEVIIIFIFENYAYYDLNFYVTRIILIIYRNMFYFKEEH